MGVFRGGIPLEPDLKELDKRYPADVFYPGVKIPYADVAEVINCDVRSYRFKTITTAWRKRIERRHGKVIGTLAGQAFIVLDEISKLDLADSKIKTALRCARRSAEVVAKISVDGLDEDGRRRLTQTTNKSSVVIAALANKRDPILPAMMPA